MELNEFVEKVSELRHYQKDYATTRSRESKKRVASLQKEVDSELKAYHKEHGQPKFMAELKKEQIPSLF